MNLDQVSLLLAALGGTFASLSWVGRRTGDASRDVWLMFGVGAGLLGLACALYA